MLEAVTQARRPISKVPVSNMTDQETNRDSESLVTVAERADELSAAILVSVLEDEGIRAVSTGGFTSGFRAEAPGMVKVRTFEGDAKRAKAIIAELKTEWPEELRDPGNAD